GLRADRPLGDGLRHEERDERAAEPEDGRERQERYIVDAVRGEPAIETEHADDDGQHHHHGKVGGNQKQDPLHGYWFSFAGLSWGRIVGTSRSPERPSRL